MKSAVALALTVVVFVAPFSVAVEDREEKLGVSIIQVDEAIALISWTPAPSASGYAIFRGTSEANLRQIGESPTLFFLDDAPLNSEAIYVVVNTDDLGYGQYRGSCVTHRGTTGISITTAHCLPAP